MSSGTVGRTLFLSVLSVGIAGPMTRTTLHAGETATAKQGKGKEADPKWPPSNYLIEPPDVVQLKLIHSKGVRKTTAAPTANGKAIAKSSGMPINGQYLVGPDGTINLRDYGVVQIAGKTTAETKAVVEKQLAKFFDAPEVTVDMINTNSKVYYVVTYRTGLVNSVQRLPITGEDTVLDALSQIEEHWQPSSSKIWLARPAASASAKQTILPVDYEAIASAASTDTNYPLRPSDRVFIEFGPPTAPGDSIETQKMSRGYDQPALLEYRPRLNWRPLRAAARRNCR